MIKYISTRGKDSNQYRFSQSLLKGLAKDNGLLSPEKLPRILERELVSLVGKSYQEIALFVFKKFDTDFSAEVLQKVIINSYGKNFNNKKITPVIKLKKNYFLLELWHGPTAAFKDMALQIMPHLFLEAIKKSKLKKRYLILAATSGDTGKAALEGYKNLPGISIIVLYPKNKVSKLQELQMTTQEGNNLEVLAIKGNFDQTQTLVKEVFGDSEFNEILAKKFKTELSSANSINWGRLIPQIIYYFTAYIELVKNKQLIIGSKINIAVPTGNFGNILAAFIAKQMGLPVNKLICAANENNSVSQFLTTGTYDISQKNMKPTYSPAMDILIASNIERLLFIITKDPDKVCKWMGQLKLAKKFKVDKLTLKILQEDFLSFSVSNEDTLKAIRESYLRNNYLVDPHTAVGIKAAERFSDQTGDRPVLIASTAHWSKFPSAIYRALGLKPKNMTEFNMLSQISRLENVSKVPDSISKLEKEIVKFKKMISPNLNRLKDSILAHLSNVKT